MQKGEASFKNKVLIPIMSIFVLSIIIISVINCSLLYSSVKNRTNANLEIFIDSIIGQIKQLDVILDTVKQTVNKKNIAISKAVAYILENELSDITASELQELADRFSIAEINIVNSEGILVNSNISDNIGSDYNSEEVTQIYFSLISGELTELAEEPRYSMSETLLHEHMTHYTGISLSEARGFVQLGFPVNVLTQLKDNIRIESLVKNTKISDNSLGMVLSNGIIVTHSEDNMLDRDVSNEEWYKSISSGGGFKWLNIDGVTYYAGFKNIDNNTVLGLVPEMDFNKSLNRMLLYTFMVFIIVIVIIIFMVDMILDKLILPIRTLSNALRKIASGKLNTSVATDEKDEIGQLSRDVAIVVKQFVTLTDEINIIYQEMLIKGDMDYQVDVESYNGDYRKVIYGINDMLAASSSELKEIMNAFTSISEGDFSSNIRSFSGKKAVVNESFDLVKYNLQSIYFEIDSRVKSASEGKLEMRVDTSRYFGDWSSLMIGLNKLLDSIIFPIREASDALYKISNEDYDARVIGDYQGEFAVIKNSVNATAVSITSYIGESKATLNILKNILNGLDAYLYVSDPATDRLLFINDNMKEHFNIKEDVIGEICWKVLQSGFDSRCEFCPCHQLEKDPFDTVIWEEQNTVTNRYYRNTDRFIDWPGSKKAHLQQSVDITDLKSYMNDKLQAERSAHESELAKGRAEAAKEAIISSITYASKIQRNLLPNDSVFKEAFSDYSIIWSPRDIVGGDIYWIKNFDEGTVLCVCDCTGHGTPGALLTMLVVSAFEAMINNDNYKDTAEIIWMLEQRLVSILGVTPDSKIEGNLLEINDGCDLAVLYIAKDGSVDISAGNTSVFICDGTEVNRIRGQKIFVGEGKLKGKEDIEIVKIPQNPYNKFYIASDGLFDQIGHKTNMPFGYKKFTQIILENHQEEQSVISQRVWEAFEHYQGWQSRRDDFELITFKP